METTWVWNLYGFITLSMESCVFWTLVGIFMVSKPGVWLGIHPNPRFVGSWVEKP